MPISLSPAGVLLLDEAGLAALEPRVEEGLRIAAAGGSGQLLGHLATAALDTPFPPAGAFWQSFARLFFTQLCHRPESDLLALTEQPEESVLAALADSAPPMTGAEYLTVGVLQRLWGNMDAWVMDEVQGKGGRVAAWLHSRQPVWNLVGRVTFHLAENKRNPDHPFAFLATYTHRVSDQAKPQYQPLGRALQEYAGARNRAALLSLLEPVQRAAQKSALVRELVDSQKVFQPQAWSAREAHQFLREIPLFEECGLLVRLPNWWRGGRAPRPAVSITVGAGKPSGIGLDALVDFNAALTLEGETLTPAEWEQLLKGEDGLVRLRDQWVEVDKEKIQSVLQHWRVLDQGRRHEGISIAEGLRLLAGAPTEDKTGDAAAVRAWSQVHAGEWLEMTLNKLRSPDAGGEAPPPGLRAELRPYQRAGVFWLRFLTGLGLGACLADDMGLGKTVQVLGALLHWRAEQPAAAPALVVLPATLLGNWSVEAARFAPSLRIFTAHPSVADAATLAAFAANPAAVLPGVDVVFTTYGMVYRLEWIRRREWSWVILDEAQAIKNHGTRQAKAIKQLRAGARAALTGTPIENSLGDLWSLFDFLNPGLLGGPTEFTRQTKKLGSSGDTSFAPLRRLIRPYILRRLKTDKTVIADLPDKTEVTALCNLTPRQAAIYEQTVRELSEQIERVDGMERRGVVLAFIMRFKQLCNHPAHLAGTGDFDPAASGKFQRLRELASEIAARGEKVLVFTQFREMTGPLRHYLTGIFGRPGLLLHGATPVKERRLLVDQFQRPEGPPFFVLSLKAGGVGLNLTEASHVIHFDRWWNPAVENQATDRAFRIGQRKNVLVHKFVCRGTIEEKIDLMLQQKQALATEMLATGGESALTEMKNDELLRFVALDLRAAVQAD